MKYRFAFVDALTEKLILEYQTDAEPPRVGDLFQPFMITNDKDTNTYRVKTVYHIPESQAVTSVIIELEVDKK